MHVGVQTSPLNTCHQALSQQRSCQPVATSCKCDRGAILEALIKPDIVYQGMHRMRGNYLVEHKSRMTSAGNDSLKIARSHSCRANKGIANNTLPPCSRSQSINRCVMVVLSDPGGPFTAMTRCSCCRNVLTCSASTPSGRNCSCKAAVSNSFAFTSKPCCSGVKSMCL